MKKKEIIILASILLAVLAFFLAFELTKKEGAYVSVAVDGKEIARYSLSVDGEYTLNNGTNILKIENGEAWMIYADCPKRLNPCTKQGSISKTREVIVCLPNKLTVTVYGAGDGVDLIS